MAGNPQNLEQGVRGSTITLDVWFRAYTGGALTDPDSTPTYEIKDPSGASMATGSGTKVSTGYYTATYSIPSNATISTLWQIVWTAAINGVAVSGATEYFEVVAAGAVEFDETATISDYWLNHVKKVLAYPSVDNIILTDAQIKSFCVYPALREYFTKFPLKETTEHELSTTADTEIDFDDSDTYGVIDARVVGKETISGSGSSFWDLVYYNQMGLSPMRGSSYGLPKYNPGGRKQAIQLGKLAASSQANEATFDIRIDHENSQVIIHTNSHGKANITWAKMSSDFDNVRFVYKLDVVKIAQAYLLEHLAMLTGMINTNIEISVNSDMLADKAKELREEVIEKWNSIPDIIVIRST